MTRTDGEKRPLKALTQLAKAATNEELQNAFTSHAKETAADCGAVPADIVHFVARVVVTPTDASHRPWGR